MNCIFEGHTIFSHYTAVMNSNCNQFPGPAYGSRLLGELADCTFTVRAYSYYVCLVHNKKSIHQFLLFKNSSRGCFSRDKREKNISLRPSLPPQMQKKKKRWALVCDSFLPSSSPACWNLPISQQLRGNGSITLMI